MFSKLFVCQRMPIRHFSKLLNVELSSEVKNALNTKGPVVALESTIITHGMPFPQNYETALLVENTIRHKEAVPATIALIKGKIKIGLTSDELLYAAENASKFIKVSRRDISYVTSQQLNGSTTVAATMLLANLVGIPIFATGGIGGVHRGADKTMDISADLRELGRTPVAVFCAGVKSILDIGRTLEYLETEGVFVATYGPDKTFPCFYSSRSNFKSPYNMETPSKVAGIILEHETLKLKNGLLIAVPIPEQYSLPYDKIETIILKALSEAEHCNISGKDITPFLLKKIAEFTEGKSLSANIELVKNNASIAAEVAVELSKLKSKSSSSARSCVQSVPSVAESKKQEETHEVVVIGGSMLDFVTTISDQQLKLDGRSHKGKISQNAGGVARNIADALNKLGTSAYLISAVGDDIFGSFILDKSLSHLKSHGVLISKDSNTGTFSVYCDNKGDCQFIVGDNTICESVTRAYVQKYEHVIASSKMVVFDGNLNIDTIDYLLEICHFYTIPVWFEPTDVTYAGKPFNNKKNSGITYCSPNYNETKVIHEALYGNVSQANQPTGLLQHAEQLARDINKVVDNVIITLGKHGVLVVKKVNGLSVSKLYPTQIIPNQQIVNVSGAGDCFAAGFIHSTLQGLSEEDAIQFGFKCAVCSLRTAATVPQHFHI